MPDEAHEVRAPAVWQTLVRERLGTLGLSADGEDEVVTELAAHLEDRFAAAMRGGAAETDALAGALQEVPDWLALNREITAAKEDPMNDRMRTLWLPGMTMLVTAFILLSGFARMVGDEDDVLGLRAALKDSSALPIFWTWLALYAVLGALGARWSQHAGGSTRARLAAGLFPIALHVAIFVAVFTATSLQATPRTPEWLVPGFLLRVFLAFILVPAAALALGALPFLWRSSLPPATQATESH